MLLAVDWQMVGSLADWTTAGVALLAFAVAAVAARFTAQTNRAQQETLELQRKQYEDAQRQLERVQAEKVSFYEKGDPVTAFMILNASESPIFAVAVALEGRGDGPRVTVVARVRELLPTGAEPKELQCERSLHPGEHYSSSLEFLDASGRSWCRDYSNELTRLA